MYEAGDGLTRVLYDVRCERQRQDKLCAAGRFPWTCAYPDAHPSDKLAVLAEEFGEVARAVVEQDVKNLREELVQVAAVCAAWVEALDRGV